MYNHSPPTRHPHSSYALKPVLSAPTSIRPSQNKAVEKIDTAAQFTQIRRFLSNF